MFKPKGIIINFSRFSVDETTDRLVEVLKNKGATVYAVINQQSELDKAGIKIFPMKLVLFGSPKSGGTIMAENPIAGLDLPLKVLIWEDVNNSVSVAYNDAGYLGIRYGLSPQLTAVLDIDPLVKKVLEMN